MASEAGPALEDEDTEDETAGKSVADHPRNPQTVPKKLPPPSSMPEYRSISTVSQPPCAFKSSNQGAGASPAMASSSSPSSASPSSSVCFTCSRYGETQTLHRLTEDGTTKRLCSLCVLSRHRGMYCSLCLLVYKHTGDIGDPGLWLTCSKCQRLCHLECARTRDIPTDSLFFECRDCLNSKKINNPSRDSSNLNKDASDTNKASSNMDANSQSNPNLNSDKDGDGGSMNKKKPTEPPNVSSTISTAGEGCGITCGSNKKPRDSTNLGSEAEGCEPNKRPRLNSETYQEISPEEDLAAAQIVANIALRQAKEAKDKARALASTSAKASARAKLALDAAHRAALEEARYRNELVPRPPSVSSSLYPRKGLGTPPYPPSPVIRSDHLYTHAFPRPHPHEGLIAKRLNTTTNNNNSNVNVRPNFTAPYHHPNHPRIKSMPAPPSSSLVPSNNTRPNMMMGTSGVQKGGSHKVIVEPNHHTAVGPPSSLSRVAPSSQGILSSQAHIGGSGIGASKTNETTPKAMTPSHRLDSSTQHTSSASLPNQTHMEDVAVKENGTDSSAPVPSGTSQTRISRTDIVISITEDTAMDCSFPATCPVTNTMVTDTLGELKHLSPASGHAVDDFVDMGILLAEECEKIKQSGMVEASVVSDQSDLVPVKADAVRHKVAPKNVQSDKEFIDKESGNYVGEGSADDEQGQCVHDGSAPVTTEVH